ncbi:hypothetical protein JW968_05845 [Candidatus Woesearchaeota archaeon]|nr:hypothetical protein [Candidatus Woesearchaeota archaeon]
MLYIPHIDNQMEDSKRTHNYPALDDHLKNELFVSLEDLRAHYRSAIRFDKVHALAMLLLREKGVETGEGTRKVMTYSHHGPGLALEVGHKHGVPQMQIETLLFEKLFFQPWFMRAFYDTLSISFRQTDARTSNVHDEHWLLERSRFACPYQNISLERIASLSPSRITIDNAPSLVYHSYRRSDQSTA